MKKLLSLFLVVLMLLSLTACGGNGSGAGNIKGEVDGGDYSHELITEVDPNNPTVLGVFYRNIIGADILSDDPAVKEIDKKADEMLKNIEELPDTIKAADGCKTYYVSAEGDDGNDGLSPQTPKKTYASFKGKLQPGDAVLFRRGDVFRGQQVIMTGVSYGAYGSGIKPRFYGSVDGKQGEWKETSTKGVYEYSKVVKYGNIIFDNGKALGRPVTDKKHITKKALNVFYNGAKLQVYSPDGTPAEIFKFIEIIEDYSLFVGPGGGFKDVKMQNLCMMYTGVHFLGTLGRVENLEVEGCIMGYCGGKNLYLGNKSVSLGNCIEFWSQAVNIDIHHSYFFQAFDAALTHQGPTKVTATGQTSKTDYTNIKYRDNLLEYNTYDFEAFSCRELSAQADNPDGTFTYNDVYITGNICRYNGYSWGSLDRPDKQVYTNFKYDAEGEQNAAGEWTNRHVKPLTIENNIFDRSRKRVLGINTPLNNSENLILKNNTFIMSDRADIFKGKTLNEDYESAINQYFGINEGNTYKIVK